ncbi:Mov34-domain-containing protein [Rickenella mellea]|uniref:Mov34-domain-containing protein n=1 Tax=Rickenella mellea TaxID=50990 RepID=A0A4Y7QJS2_9AGAM|nr:Mov34-domain-containing protein [Rickenella mellea]
MANTHNNSSRHPTTTFAPPNRGQRPSSIAELAERALGGLWDPEKDFKHWLRVAERSRKSGKDAADAGDLESAFVHYAKAAALILDKMPSHREYMTRINGTQREALTMHGQELLTNLSQLKPVLSQRYDAWLATQPSGSSTSRFQDHTEHREDIRRDNRASESAARPPRREDIFWNAQNGNHHLQDQAERDRKQREAEFKARADERTRSEQAGIVQRQHQAEIEARAARAQVPRLTHISLTDSQGSAYSSSSSGTPPTYVPSSSSSGSMPVTGVPLLPLESPVQYDGESTDAEGHGDNRLSQKMAKMSAQPTSGKQSWAPSMPLFTTTSPPPEVGPIQYPQLMSQHQRTQGYAPSLQSMFIKPGIDAPPSSLLFDRPVTSSLYSNLLPPASRPVAAESPSRQGPSMPGPSSSQHQYWHPSQQRQSAEPPLRPPKEVATAGPSAKQPSPRIIPGDGKKDPVASELRNVKLPRDTLSRFIAIANVNTARNRETCGLLLGKAKGDKYIVTTLLIPKQHSTSDTCTMDEEELVLEFTEQRSLITLGWIHTHPTQSCFMSSVDLHTHSGFQRMLPESFAVVCAPQSTPNFGIFRLTDPPGLQTILKCNAKEAFHPHPDLPIYTDADKGHVQMKDATLEIVDLR